MFSDSALNSFKKLQVQFVKHLPGSFSQLVDGSDFLPTDEYCLCNKRRILCKTCTTVDRMGNWINEFRIRVEATDHKNLILKKEVHENNSANRRAVAISYIYNVVTNSYFDTGRIICAAVCGLHLTVYVSESQIMSWPEFAQVATPNDAKRLTETLQGQWRKLQKCGWLHPGVIFDDTLNVSGVTEPDLTLNFRNQFLANICLERVVGAFVSQRATYEMFKSGRLYHVYTPVVFMLTAARYKTLSMNETPAWKETFGEKSEEVYANIPDAAHAWSHEVAEKILRGMRINVNFWEGPPDS